VNGQMSQIGIQKQDMSERRVGRGTKPTFSFK